MKVDAFTLKPEAYKNVPNSSRVLGEARSLSIRRDVALTESFGGVLD